jgi:uncharacterized membrane protein
MGDKKQTILFIVIGIFLVLWVLTASALLGLSVDIGSAALGIPSFAGLLFGVLGIIILLAVLLDRHVQNEMDRDAIRHGREDFSNEM